MGSVSITIPAAGNGAQPCPCGCAPCEAVCCRLDCLERPRFFCGQLLTDQDLMALLGWTQDKLRLARFRHGWGVVCGLEVRCDWQNEGQVIVGPGYAVSCCGDDIIVCQDTPFDLRGVCKGGNRSLRRPVEDSAEHGLTSVHHDRRMHFSKGPTTNHRPVHPLQGGAGRSADGAGPECVPGSRRMRVWPDSRALLHRLAGRGARQRSRDGSGEEVAERYDNCLNVITDLQGYLQQFKSLDGQGEEIRKWLVGWLDKHPLTEFCCLRQQICEMAAADLQLEKNLVAIVFWIAQDCRNHFLQCACFTCGSDQGVPLARIWLRAFHDPQGGPHCCIVAIDQYPPYRRPIGPECWPAPLGFVNLGQFIWSQETDACVRANGMGLRWKIGDERKDAQGNAVLPTTASELLDKLGGGLFVRCGDELSVRVYEAPGLGARVVGFSGGTTIFPLPPTHAAMPPPAPPTPAGGGSPPTPTPSAPSAVGIVPPPPVGDRNRFAVPLTSRPSATSARGALPPCMMPGSTRSRICAVPPSSA